MRIKIIGENHCARATRHLLRLAGFAVTDFLPTDVVIHGPSAGYAITIDLSPAPHTPNAHLGPDCSTQEAMSSTSEEADRMHRDAFSSSLSQNAGPNENAAGGHASYIHFDSVDSALEAAVLRHVAQLAAGPVIVDRPGGVVHSERELRIVAPCTGDARADEAAAVAIEFGVLRGLLDLVSPEARSEARWNGTGKKLLRGDATVGAAAEENSENPFASRSRKKSWWPLFLLLIAGGIAVWSNGRGNVAAASAGGWREDTQKNLLASTIGDVGEQGDTSTVLRLTNNSNSVIPRLGFAEESLFHLSYIEERFLAPLGMTDFSRLAKSATPGNVAAAGGELVGRVTEGDRLPLIFIRSEKPMPLAAQEQVATGQGFKITDGVNFFVVDPCKAATKLYSSINQTGNTQLVAGTVSKKIYVCSIHVVAAAATNVAVVEGTGSVCGTGTAGVSGFGGATAATGWNFAGNGGIALGNGDSSLGAEGTSGDNLCIFNSGSGQVSGGISYVVE